MKKPDENIPRAIYSAIFITVLIYVVVSLGAVLAIPFDDIIENQEYSLAAGTEHILGHWGTDLVILGALLATSSAISGTLFGASRLMSVIATDGYFPEILTRKTNHIPVYSISCLSVFAFILVLAGNLELILEFGSVTFLLVSLLMAYANYKLLGRKRPSLEQTSLPCFVFMSVHCFKLVLNIRSYSFFIRITNRLNKIALSP